MMDLQKFSKVTVCVLGLGITMSACTPNATETVTSTTATTEQAAWQKLTTEAETAKAAGDSKKAEASYQAAVKEAEKLGEADPALAKSTANLADFYYAQGDGAQADRLYKQALAIHEKAVGLEHADLVQSILGLARVSASAKHYGEAVAYYDRAIAIMKKNNLPLSTEVEAEYNKAKADASTTKGSTKD